MEIIYNTFANYLYYVILIVVAIVVCLVVTVIINKLIRKSSGHKWVEIMKKNRLFKMLIRIIPGIIVYNMSPLFGTVVSIIIARLSLLYILVTIALLGKAVVNSVDDIYKTYPISKDRPIKGLLQVIEILFYIVMTILIISTLIDKSPVVFLSGIGALTAVTSLIFKDPILNFVAGIQLTWNDMLRIGDWIEVPKHNVDGFVTEISLNTIKVQNFDKSIITVPTYHLVSDSFRNWRGMFESGGRRLKRSFHIDITSVKILSKEKLEELKKINYLRDYLIEKEVELEEYNSQVENSGLLINGKQLTNLSVFRTYIEKYLSENGQIHKELMSIVRQMEFTETGIPIEIYVFTNDTQWVKFEALQAEIFDHLISVVDTFDLRIYQRPTGYDLQKN